MHSAATPHRKKPTWILGAVLSLMAAAASCRNEAPDAPARSQSPGTTIAAPAKLLESTPADAEPPAANPLGGCDMCHVDVEDELTGNAHHAEGVGCVECHGPSEGHVADENNEVLPDRVFARKDVDSFCEKCHECSRPTAAEPATTPEDRKVCTECHGAHDLVLAVEKVAEEMHLQGGGPPAASPPNGGSADSTAEAEKGFAH